MSGRGAAPTAKPLSSRYRKQKQLGPAPIASFDVSFESTEEVRLKVCITIAMNTQLIRFILAQYFHNFRISIGTILLFISRVTIVHFHLNFFAHVKMIE